MTKIQGIDQTAAQLFTLVLPDQSTCTLTLYFDDLQTGWFCDVAYQDFAVKGMRVTCNLNILAQHSNILPFGLACFTNQGQEPQFLQDFVAGNASLCLLDETDLANLETYIGTKV